jgi:putative spermidine/putrescine transport system permease protein
LGFVYLFILMPAVIPVMGAFNRSRAFPGPWQGATLEWFQRVVTFRDVLHATQVSLVTSLVAALLALVMTIPLAFRLTRGSFRGRDILAAFFMAPLAIPQIVMGLGMLLLFSQLKLPTTPVGLVLALTVFVMPYTLRALMTSLATFDWALEEAAMSLGADRLHTLWYVTLPVIRPAVVAGFAFAFVMSFGNVPISLFLSTPSFTPLPIMMLTYLDTNLDPVIAAIATLVMAGIVVPTVVVLRIVGLKLVA